MSNYLSEPVTIKGHRKSHKRLGRGIGSGKGGHTSTKGHKGHKARKGGQSKLWFEGGQTPLIKRMPYIKGFKRHTRRHVESLNFMDLKSLLDDNKLITPELLIEKGLIDKPELVLKYKILSRGELKSAVNFKGFIYTDKAIEKITKAGGKAE